MADTDSALKTQMFMSESQRQSALDLSARIAQGFQAAGDGIKFKGEIQRSMVQSAAQFKQLEIDEFYKNEHIKLGYAQLALQEAATKLNADIRADDLNYKREILNQTILDRQVREDERNQDKDFRRVGEVLQNREGMINDKINLYVKSKKEVDDEIRRIDNLGKTDPVAYPKGLRDKMKVGLSERISSYDFLLEESYKNKERLGKLNDHSLRRSLEPNVIIEMIDGQLPQDTHQSQIPGGPNPNIDSQVDSSLFNFNNENDELPKTNKKIIPDSESGASEYGATESEAAPTLNTKEDRSSYFTIEELYGILNDTESTYNPTTARAYYEKLPEEEKKKFATGITNRRAIDAAYKAHSALTGTEYKSKEDFERAGDVLNERINDHEAKITIAEEARKIGAARLNIELPNKDGTPRNWHNVETDLLSLNDFKQASANYFKLGGNPTDGPSAPSDRPAKALGRNVNFDNVDNTSSKGVDQYRADKYVKLLGFTGSLDDTLDNRYDDILSQSKALTEYERAYDEFAKNYDDKNYLASELMKVPDELLGANRDFFGESNYDPTVDRKRIIKSLISNGGALKILAENRLRELGHSEKYKIASKSKGVVGKTFK